MLGQPLLAARIRGYILDGLVRHTCAAAARCRQRTTCVHARTPRAYALVTVLGRDGFMRAAAPASCYYYCRLLPALWHACHILPTLSRARAACACWRALFTTALLLHALYAYSLSCALRTH